MAQVMDVANAINQKGQHVVLFGERGVGKTSLANILPSAFVGTDGEPLRSVKVNCSTGEGFPALWGRVFREIGRKQDFDALWTEVPPGPEDIRYLLQALDERLLIVVDELDRFEDDDGLSMLADTLKTLSDNAVDCHLGARRGGRFHRRPCRRTRINRTGADPGSDPPDVDR